MKTVIRLAAAAALITATGLAPGLAAADEHGERREQGRGAWGHDEHRGGRPDDRYEGRFDDRRDGRLDDRFDRRGRWDEARAARAERLRQVRFELRRLDDGRADFHARFSYRPRKLARYDAWYFEQRAVLEQELARLTWYAWR